MMEWNLISAFDIFDSNKLFGVFISHESSNAEIPWSNISNEIVTVAVVHDRHIHGRRRRIHRSEEEVNDDVRSLWRIEWFGLLLLLGKEQHCMSFTIKFFSLCHCLNLLSNMQVDCPFIIYKTDSVGFLWLGWSCVIVRSQPLDFSFQDIF